MGESVKRHMRCGKMLSSLAKKTSIVMIEADKPIDTHFFAITFLPSFLTIH
jgi:hypothetical protein